MESTDLRKDIFFSYSHKDKDIVLPIAEEMIQKNYRCWIDRNNLRANEMFNVKINQAIDACTIFLVFLSRNYLSSAYCRQQEFDVALSLNKTIIRICIDTSMRNTVREANYIFDYNAGSSIFGYGVGVEEDSYVPTFVEQICSSYEVQLLKQERDPKQEEIRNLPSDQLLNQLSYFNETQYQLKGNYYHQENLSCLLYAPLRDEQTGRTYFGKEEDMPLIQFLRENPIKAEHPWTMIVGEGGIGKSVSLQNCCRYLLRQQIYAIYIPISKLTINPEIDNNIEKYIQNVSSAHSMTMVSDLMIRMRNKNGQEHPVFLILDGLNETKNPTEFVKKELQYFENGFDNLHIILSSRMNDRNALSYLSQTPRILEIDALEKKDVRSYLEQIDPSLSLEDPILDVLKTPLIATLYAETERHRKEYETVRWIRLDAPANTSGKILWNYLQSQIYRASKERNFELRNHLITLNFIFPAVAFYMNQSSDGNRISRRTLISLCKKELGGPKMEIYAEDELYDCTGSSILPSPMELFDTATSALNLLQLDEETNQYVFPHPVFQDFFAALYIANEMKLLKEEGDLKDELSSLLVEQSLLSTEILKYVSDVTHEEEARPYCDEKGWTFPGKKSIKASTKSLVEPLLAYYRGREDEEARNAVYNLLNIMNYGRDRNLSYCDFSKLDLRSCTMNSTFFTNFYDKEQYASCFDGAWIHRAFFSLQGHRSKITAICITEDGTVYSGDQNGVIRCSTKGETISYLQEPILALLEDPKKHRLLFAYAYSIHSYDLYNQQIRLLASNPFRNQKYHSLKLNPQGEPVYSWNSDPLCFYDFKGNRMEYSISGICAVHADMRADGTQYAFSLPDANLAVYTKQTGTEQYNIHPSILENTVDPAYSLTLHGNAEDLEREAEVVLPNGNRVAGFMVEATQTEGRTTVIVKLPGEDSKNIQMSRNQRNYVKELLRAKYVREAQIAMVSPMLGKFCGLPLDADVSSLLYSPDGKKLVVSGKNYLALLDAETLTVLHVHKATAKISCVSCNEKRIVYGAGTHISILDWKLDLKEEKDGWPLAQVKWIIVDPAGEYIYILNESGYIQKLNKNLQVVGTRLKAMNKVFWAEDRRTKRLQMITGTTQKATRYDFETDQEEPLGWCYRILNPVEDFNVDLVDDHVIAIEPNTGRLLDYVALNGITISGCSFRNIVIDDTTEKAKEEFKNILKQNGGILE